MSLYVYRHTYRYVSGQIYMNVCVIGMPYPGRNSGLIGQNDLISTLAIIAEPGQHPGSSTMSNIAEVC